MLREFYLKPIRLFLLALSLILLLLPVACGDEEKPEVPAEDPFAASTGFKRGSDAASSKQKMERAPKQGSSAQRMLNTPGPKRKLNLPTATPTPTPAPTQAPTQTPTPTPTPVVAPTPPAGSPLGLVPIYQYAMLDCDYLRNNQDSVAAYLQFDIVGDDGPNTINGTEGPDVIDGGGGNDTINGLGGNDIICGGPGLDVIHGNDGEDALFGETGPDILYGGSGRDTLVGGPGDDSGSDNNTQKGLDGGQGDDWLYGGAGDDRMEGGPGNDTLFGGQGDDKIYGDYLEGTEEKDCPTDVIGNAPPEPCRDWIYGGFGNDSLFGGPDNDSIDGDIIPIEWINKDAANQYYPDEWFALKQQGSPIPPFGNDLIHGNQGNDWLRDPGSDGLPNNIWGQEGDDIIIGGEDIDYVYGGLGNDEAWGRGGNDQMHGDENGDPEDNFDKLYGGEGFDILSIADLKIGGPNPPDHPDRCVDNAPQFEVICDDDL